MFNMYVEKNGYILMNKDTMEFLTQDYENPKDTSGDVDDAYVYEDIGDALYVACNMNKELEENIYEVIRYQKTIWLDKANQEQIKTTIETHSCFGAGCDCCNCKEGDNVNE